LFLGITHVCGLSAGAVAEAALVTIFNGTDTTVHFHYYTKGLLGPLRRTSQRIGAYRRWNLDTSLAKPSFSVRGDDGSDGPGFARAFWGAALAHLCVDGKVVYVRNGAVGKFIAVNHGTCGAPSATGR